MDLEEQRLKHHIEAREIALKQKINVLKERIEHFKRMVDVKSKVQQRPGLMFMGSILVGFLTKKLASGKHTDSRPVPHISKCRWTFLGPRERDNLGNSYPGGHRNHQ